MPKRPRAQLPSVGEQIREARTSMGISQVELANRLATSQSAVARLESPDYDGHSLRSLREVAAALGRTILIRLGTPDEVEEEIANLPEEVEPTEGQGPRRGRPRKTE